MLNYYVWERVTTWGPPDKVSLHKIEPRTVTSEKVRRKLPLELRELKL